MGPIRVASSKVPVLPLLTQHRKCCWTKVNAPRLIACRTLICQGQLAPATKSIRRRGINSRLFGKCVPQRPPAYDRVARDYNKCDHAHGHMPSVPVWPLALFVARFAQPRRLTISVLLCLNVFRMDCVSKYQYPFRFRSSFPSPFRSGQAMMDADCVLNWYCQFPPP